MDLQEKVPRRMIDGPYAHLVPAQASGAAGGLVVPLPRAGGFHHFDQTANRETPCHRTSAVIVTFTKLSLSCFLKPC